MTVVMLAFLAAAVIWLSWRLAVAAVVPMIGAILASEQAKAADKTL
jgi:hypothetical protein